MEKTAEIKIDPKIEGMFKAGAHFGYSKARRHPSARPFIFGVKNRVEIFDLEKTTEALENAKKFVKSLGASGGQILFVSGKSEVKEVVTEAASEIGMPYVAGRWIGGTLTNFSEIRKRVDRMEKLKAEKEKGELSKYTKKEQLLLDREMERLSERFQGLVLMKEKPDALFVIDLKKESIAVKESKDKNVPVISLSGSDCDLSLADYPIPANDSALSSIKFFLGEVTSAYKEGLKEKET